MTFLTNLALNWHVDKTGFIVGICFTIFVTCASYFMLREAKEENWLRGAVPLALFFVACAGVTDIRGFFYYGNQRILNGFQEVQYINNEVIFTFKPAVTTKEMVFGKEMEVEKAPADEIRLSLYSAKRLEEWAAIHKPEISETAMRKLTLAVQ